MRPARHAPRRRQMPVYPLSCANCGDQETFATMSEARKTDLLACPVCERPRPRRIVLFQHTEDRTHMWKGPLGNGYSTALGEQMPDSRSERDRLAKKKGIEFCTKAELLADSKEAAEAYAYRQHVNQGGARDEPIQHSDAAFVPKPAWASDLGI